MLKDARLKPFDHLVLVVEVRPLGKIKSWGFTHLFFGDIMEYLSFHGYAGAGARLVTLAELEVQTLNLGLGELHGQPNKKPSILDGKNYRRNGGWLWKWPQTYCCFTWLYILHTT
jgi:hypothetical protein